jgi:hypothetical protein
MADESLLEIIRLMRAVNSLRFGQHALVMHRSGEGTGDEADGKEYPSMTRSLNSSFLYLSALLFEIVVRRPSLGRHYRKHPAYEEYARFFKRG